MRAVYLLIRESFISNEEVEIFYIMLGREMPGFDGEDGPARAGRTAAHLRVAMVVGNTRDGSDLPI